MSLRWCAFTGALMLVAVFLTFAHREVSQDPPGVTTRWWDGTTSVVEKYYGDGQVMMRTEYGDDGRTVIKHEQFSREGELQRLKERLQNGLVEEKVFTWDGSQLEQHTIWSADESYFLMQRTFHFNGKLREEVIMTEDGTIPVSTKVFYENGELQMHHQIKDNADQERNQYSSEGVLTMKHIFKANGDSYTTYYMPDGKTPRFRNILIRLTGEDTTEYFTETGELRESMSSYPDTGERAATTYVDGKPPVRRVYRYGIYHRVEELSAETGEPTRTLILTGENSVGEVRLFRGDGTLRRVKKLDAEGNVIRQIDYDEAGENVVSETEGGEPEDIDPKLIDPFASTEEGENQ